MSLRGSGPSGTDGEPHPLAIWRFDCDHRRIIGRTCAEVVTVLRLRCQVGFPPEMAAGPLGPFCALFAERSGAAEVDAALPDEEAAEALLVALAEVGQAARVRPGSLRLVGG